MKMSRSNYRTYCDEPTRTVTLRSREAALKPVHRSVLLADYMSQVAPTDVLSPEGLQPVLLGLFGEVGSIMATAKKFHREGEVYAGFRCSVEEEFGDVLWYFTALCRRLNMRLDEILAAGVNEENYETAVAANDLIQSPLSHVATPKATYGLDATLFELGNAASALFVLQSSTADARTRLVTFADWYLRALEAAGVTFAEVASRNIAKTVSRFLDPDYANLPQFDTEFRTEERLPDRFEITIDQRSSGRSYLSWKGVFIGDPLTDNIGDADGYRFHDAFHLAHAAILHWSPVFRALIKHKRKSEPEVEEAQDSGRAIVVEEGLTAWLFSRAKELNFFDNQDRVSFDLLKTVQQFVAGYEVDECPLRLWEIAILRGYDVFRKVRSNNGGVIIGDRSARTIEYRPLLKG
jgi:NTP pyrophosphatase (non-canonical NTP hydrolase)